MTAAVLGGVGQKLQIDEVELAPPRDGEALVKVAASGLCASDLNVIDGKRTLAPFPLVLGHEAAGVVTQTGPGVTRLKVGDAVVMSIVPSCGGCPACVRGRRNYCQTAGRAMGRGSLLDGSRRLSRNGQPLHHFLTVSSFAQYAVVPESGAVAIDARMPLDRAALISCAVLTGVGAVRNTARVRPGSRVAVFGCGGIGLNAVQGARLAGAARIAAVDVTEEKLDLARRFGATDVVHAGQEDPAAAIRRLMDGADYAFEAAGREQTVRLAWVVSRCGRRGRRRRAHASRGHGDARRRWLRRRAGHPGLLFRVGPPAARRALADRPLSGRGPAARRAHHRPHRAG